MYVNRVGLWFFSSLTFYFYLSIIQLNYQQTELDLMAMIFSNCSALNSSFKLE